jgi:hypothetical protein
MKVNKFSIYILFILFILFITFYYILYKNFLIEKFSTYNNKYTAIIIEPREHKALSFVLKNFLENLSDEWNIIIMHGNKNIDYINNIINNDLSEYKNRIIMKNLNIDNLTIKDYNKLLVSKKFYEEIPTEILLIFQTDSIICESNKERINDFLEYDYVGAPWEKGGVGNGGLSLRRKSAMIKKIENCQYDNEAEDLFFYNNKCYKLNIPDEKTASYFSTEQVYNKDSFGTHKSWLWLKPNEFNEMNNYCKNLDDLANLQYKRNNRWVKKKKII